ncbi:MAG: flagellar basal body rod protein FlgC [Tepidisphaeraceae bacterium]
MFDLLDIGASGLTAQRTRMDTIAGNVLNQSVTRGKQKADGTWEPYRRRLVVMQTGAADDPRKPGVHVTKVEEDQSAFRIAHEPWNPEADADGNVKYPNVDMTYEMVNMIDASRAYEANVTMMETTKQMLNATMRLLA